MKKLQEGDGFNQSTYDERIKCSATPGATSLFEYGASSRMAERVDKKIFFVIIRLN
jgi:hypothetical protein